MLNSFPPPQQGISDWLDLVSAAALPRTEHGFCQGNPRFDDDVKLHLHAHHQVLEVLEHLEDLIQLPPLSSLHIAGATYIPGLAGGLAIDVVDDLGQGSEDHDHHQQQEEDDACANLHHHIELLKDFCSQGVAVEPNSWRSMVTEASPKAVLEPF